MANACAIWKNDLVCLEPPPVVGECPNNQDSPQRFETPPGEGKTRALLLDVSFVANRPFLSHCIPLVAWFDELGSWAVGHDLDRKAYCIPTPLPYARMYLPLRHGQGQVKGPKKNGPDNRAVGGVYVHICNNISSVKKSIHSGRKQKNTLRARGSMKIFGQKRWCVMIYENLNITRFGT